MLCQNVVEENIRQLRQKDDEIRDALTKMDSTEEVDIDDVIQPSAPLYKQSVNSLLSGLNVGMPWFSDLKHVIS